MKPKITIDEIKRLNESYKAPDGYFDSLADKIDARKEEKLPLIRISDIVPIEESYQVPEGYFEGLMEKIEERKGDENNVVKFRQRRIRIWGSFVAAACITLVVVSAINFGPKNGNADTFANLPSNRLEKISDKEIASLLEDRDDEFQLTEDEIIEVIEHETVESESTAIIDFLQDEDLDGVNEDEDFLDEI